MDYQVFLQSKRNLIGNFGFDAKWYPEIAFDFQKYIIEKSIKKGRIANFIDTGLGKTLLQLSEAYNIVLHTNKKVLILTPKYKPLTGLFLFVKILILKNYLYLKYSNKLIIKIFNIK